MKQPLIFLLAALVAGLVGCEKQTTEPPTPPGPEPPTVKIQSYPYLIEGENTVLGYYAKFSLKMKELFRGAGILGGYPLASGVDKYYGEIKRYTSIIGVPPTPPGIAEYGDLEKVHADLCPLGSAKLSEFRSLAPFLYFTRDKDSVNLLRGVILADAVDTALAVSIYQKGVVLNQVFRYDANNMIVILK
jgi:hypothetical protein